MFDYQSVFSGFSVDDVEAARTFYEDTLGLDVGSATTEDGVNMLNLRIDGGHVLIYGKPDHVPASYTVLNFEVADIRTAVQQLTSKSVKMIRYDGFNQDELGVSRGLGTGQGPDIAWFNDPAGNILAVLQNA